MVVVPCSLAFGVQIGEYQRDFCACWHMDLGAVGPDCVNKVDHPVHFRIGVCVDQIFGGVSGPISVHQHFGATVGKAPQLFCDERHDRVQHDQGLVQDPAQCGLRFQFGGLVGALQDWLGKFQIPVANLAPCERIQRVGCIVETVGVECGIHGFAGFADFTDDPFVQGLRDLGPRRVAHIRNFIVFCKTERIPKLGAKVAVPFDPVLADFQHATKGRHLRVGEPQSIGPEFVDHVERVDDVALGLGHLVAFGVADQLVQVHGVKRVFFQNGLAHHHHAGDPEEQDVLACNQHVTGEVFHRVVVFGPAKRAEWPKAGGEPCVEDVRVAPNLYQVLGRYYSIVSSSLKLF